MVKKSFNGLIPNLNAALVCDKQLMSQQRLQCVRSDAEYLRRRYAMSVYNSVILLLGNMTIRSTGIRRCDFRQNKESDIPRKWCVHPTHEKTQ